MKSPFSKTHSEALSMEGLTREEFLTIAYDAVHKLDVDLAYFGPHHIIYYTRVSYKGDAEVVSIAVDDHQAQITSKGLGSRLIDFGKSKKNIKDFAGVFDEVQAALTKEELATKYENLVPLLSPDDPDEYSKYLNSGGSVKDILSIFIPSKEFVVTPLLIDINILVFIAMCIAGVSAFNPSTEQLLLWGGDFRALTINGGWWRLFTSMFLHAGIFHLLMNMYALLYIGILLEPLLGRTRYTAAYLLSGICSGLMSITVHSFTVGVGASGAIFGMYGVFLAMLTTNLIEKNARKAMLQSILIFVGYNLLNGVKGNIDNAAHIGGLLSGMLIGYAYFPGLKKGDESRNPLPVILALSVLVIATTVVTFIMLPDPVGRYQKKMEQFSEYETKALKVYQFSSDSVSRDTLLYYINEGTEYWKKNEQLVDDVLNLDLPDEVQKRNRILKNYCLIRQNTYDLMYKQVHDNNDAYADKIKEYNEEIESLINQLKQ